MKKQKRGKYRKAVFIITYFIDKDKKKNKKPVYLVLKRKLHWKGWEFPKGGIEKNETFILAVKREIGEETGLKIKNIKKFNLRGKYRYNKEYKDRRGFIGQEYVLFSAEVRKNKVKLDKLEHSAYKWLPYSKAVNLLTWPNQRRGLGVVKKDLNLSKSK